MNQGESGDGKMRSKTRDVCIDDLRDQTAAPSAAMIANPLPPVIESQFSRSN